MKELFKNQLLHELRQAGYASFMVDMVAQGAQTVFENAETIHHNQQAYEHLYDGGFMDDDMLENLLDYKDPLHVMREQWEFWSGAVLTDEMDTSNEMGNALRDFLDEAGAGYHPQYEREALSPPQEPEQGQQMY